MSGVVLSSWKNPDNCWYEISWLQHDLF